MSKDVVQLDRDINKQTSYIYETSRKTDVDVNINIMDCVYCGYRLTPYSGITAYHNHSKRVAKSHLKCWNDRYKTGTLCILCNVLITHFDNLVVFKINECFCHEVCLEEDSGKSVAKRNVDKNANKTL